MPWTLEFSSVFVAIVSFHGSISRREAGQPALDGRQDRWTEGRRPGGTLGG